MLIKYVKNITFFIFLVIFCFPSVADNQKRKSWTEWPRVMEAVAKRGNQTLAVFHEPKRPSNILIYPDCWFIKRKTKVVLSGNCPFKLAANRLYFDDDWGFRPDGVAWGDAKMGNISFFSLIFRRPIFTETSVSIWDGQEWLFIEGLSNLK